VGTYVYTARAMGRIPAWIDGEYHQIFPMHYDYKPWPEHPKNEFWRSRAEAQAKRTESRPDWTGYVSWAGNVYKVDSALWDDNYPLGKLMGQIYAGPMGAEVR
jgi:hypothetical protein